MALSCYVSDAILEKVHLETGLQEVFTSVFYTELGGYSADKHVCRVEEFQDLSQSLLCGVEALEAGVLLQRLVISLVECQFLADVRLQVFVYLATVRASPAMCRPGASQGAGRGRTG